MRAKFVNEAVDIDDIKKSWEDKHERDANDENFNQLCVWPGTSMDGASPEDFEDFMKENFGVRTKFMEEVTTNPGQGGDGGRKDLFFYIHNADIQKFAMPRLQVGIRWWEDVVQNNSHLIYPPEILQKYPSTW